MFLIFLISLIFANTVNAQEILPDSLTPANILQSSGAAFGEGWNYFQVQTDACSIGQILNEIQADGGSALEAKEIWLKKLDLWEQYQYSDTIKVSSNDILAFFSNQKFFFDLDPAVCTKNDDKRQQEITKLRSPGNKGLLDSIWDGIRAKIDSFSNDFWQPVASESATLITRYSLLTPDLTVSGKFKVGFLSFDDIDASVESLTKIITFKSGISIKNDSVGTVIMPSGTTSIIVDSSYAKPESKIFVTPNEPVAISGSSTESGKVLIKISSPLPQDLKVSWWIVN